MIVKVAGFSIRTALRLLTGSIQVIEVAGCKKLISNVNGSSTRVTTANVCTAQLPYSWNGNSYSAGGSYNVTLTSSSGCDSIAFLLLSVAANSTSITASNVFASQLPYSWNGNSYNAAGACNDTLIDSSGCDSTATLILSVTDS